MMTGLPSDNEQKSLYTAQMFKELGATETRIYPTVVLKGTYLEAMYKAGRKDLMMDLIENVWGRLIDEGELCCPEYLPWIKCITKYKHPVMDSACHGSGASPAYWLQILAKENGGKL